jgi:tRNA (cytidine/uridine-2'-O-)-methyltransferase
MQSQLRLALFQPDQPANTGAMMRLCACLGVPLDIIEPCGFVFDDRKLKRVAMDYIDHLSYRRHLSWNDFRTQLQGRLILLTTKAALPYGEFEFQPNDVLLVGRESAGVPDDIHASADARITIPMRTGLRSLNVGMAAAIVMGEALRQIEGQNEQIAKRA